MHVAQVLRPRQAATWIVLAWPRILDVMALMDIAAEDLAIACCFQSAVAPDMLLSPTRKACASRRLAYPGFDPLNTSSSGEDPTPRCTVPVRASLPRNLIPPSPTHLPSAAPHAPSVLSTFTRGQPPLDHSSILSGPLGMSPRGLGTLGTIDGFASMQQLHAPCTPPCPATKALTPDYRHMGNLELERVHSNQTPITAFLRPVAKGPLHHHQLVRLSVPVTSCAVWLRYVAANCTPNDRTLSFPMVQLPEISDAA